MAQVATSDWLMILAVLIGPLVGIWVTRWIDRAKEERDRRWELFVTLRRTRGLELSPDHVAAINMIPVLFPAHQPVMLEWEKLMDALNDQGWNSADPTVRDGVMIRAANARLNVMHRVADAVEAKLPTKEEHRLGYSPILWANEFAESFEARRLLLEVLRGKQALNMIAGVYDIGSGRDDASPVQQIE